MKVVVNRKELISALQIGGSLAGKSKLFPILDCVKVSVRDSYMQISSSDSESAVRNRIPYVESDENCEFCCDAKDLTSIVKAINEENVTLDIDKEGNNITIKHKKGKMNLPLQDESDFPKPNIDSDTTSIVVPSEKLFNWVKVAQNFVSSDALHPILGGIYMSIENNKWNIASSDACRLFCDSCDCEYNGEKVEAVVSSKSAISLINMINGTENVTINIGANNISFKTESSMLSCKKMMGKFPNYMAIIPKEHKVSAEINKKELVDSLNRTMITVNQTSGLVKLEFGNGFMMRISAEDIDYSKKSYDECTCNCVGEPITIGVKGESFKCCIDAIDSDNLEIEMTTPQRAILMKDKSNENRCVILMPMYI